MKVHLLKKSIVLMKIHINLIIQVVSLNHFLVGYVRREERKKDIQSVQEAQTAIDNHFQFS